MFGPPRSLGATQENVAHEANLNRQRRHHRPVRIICAEKLTIGLRKTVARVFPNPLGFSASGQVPVNQRARGRVATSRLPTPRSVT